MLGYPSHTRSSDTYARPLHCRSDLIKGIGTGASSGKNTKKLLDGIAQFVKTAQQWNATLTLLSQLESRPGTFAAPCPSSWPSAPAPSAHTSPQPGTP